MIVDRATLERVERLLAKGLRLGQLDDGDYPPELRAALEVVRGLLAEGEESREP